MFQFNNDRSEVAKQALCLAIMGPSMHVAVIVPGQREQDDFVTEVARCVHPSLVDAWGTHILRIGEDGFIAVITLEHMELLAMRRHDEIYAVGIRPEQLLSTHAAQMVA